MFNHHYHGAVFNSRHTRSRCTKGRDVRSIDLRQICSYVYGQTISELYIDTVPFACRQVDRLLAEF